MPEPRSAEEWAEKCNQDYLIGMRVEGKSWGHVRHGLCEYCANLFAESYAAQQTAAHVEKIMESERTIQAALILQRDALREQNEVDVINGEAWAERAREAEAEVARLTKELTEPFDAEHIISAVAVAVGSASARRVRHYVESAKADREALAKVAELHLDSTAIAGPYQSRTWIALQMALAHPAVRRAVKAVMPP